MASESIQASCTKYDQVGDGGGWEGLFPVKHEVLGPISPEGINYAFATVVQYPRFALSYFQMIAHGTVHVRHMLSDRFCYSGENC